jgi:L-threonylcarbamoyladenylate synthase
MIANGLDRQQVAHAAQLLAAGELVALPTETVYGLGADACQPQAVARIFSAKGRPSDHPLIVHVAEAADAHHFAREVPAFAQALMQRFWPGPLTLILPRRVGVATAAAGAHDSIGLRCPAHPVAQALLRAGRQQGVAGVAAPSANLFGRVSPTTAAHVQSEFGTALFILDGGPCDVGIESTIVDCTRGQPVILRPGLISRDDIDAVATLDRPTGNARPAPRASGTLEAHYAPSAPVRLMDTQSLLTALEVLGPQAAHLGVYARSRVPDLAPGLLLRVMPDSPRQAARELFATLREFDEAGVKLIWVENPPSTNEWEGVCDRLRRAAASTPGEPGP